MHLIGTKKLLTLLNLYKLKNVVVIIFLILYVCNRAPAASRIREKILYATSKDGLRRVLDGIHYEVQATDPTEMGFDVITGRAK